MKPFKVIGLLAIFCMALAPGLQAEWTIETIFTTGNVGLDNSVGTDAAGNVYISYVKWHNLYDRDLMFTTNSTGTWVEETVDSAGDVGYLCDIAVDSMNRAHISYHDYSNKILKYAQQSGAAWVIEVADAEYYTGSSNSIVLDSSDNPHIAYNEYSVLKYATRFAGAWLTEIVDMTLFTGGHGCITVDTSDTLHISYHNSDKGDLLHAHGTAFQPLAVDVDEISCTTGGTANYTLSAGAANANRPYILLGSVSGTVPGTPLPGGHATLPINFDAFTNIVINLSNTAFFTNFQANLDGEGHSSAQLNFPALPAVFLPMYYAFALPDPWNLASNPVQINLVP